MFIFATENYCLIKFKKMKKLFVVFLIACSSLSTFAQIFVGGSFGISTNGGSTTVNGTTTDKVSTLTFNLDPKVGMYLNDKMAVGLNLGFDVTRSNDHRDPKTIVRTSIYSFAPFLRYHLVEMGPVSIFGEGSIGVGFQRSKTKRGDVSVDGPKTTLFGIGVQPGVSYKINDHISIEAYLGGISYNLTSTKEDDDNKDKDHTFGINFSTNLNLGFIYKF
jgi:opacity protein-like surface antigen